MHLSQAIFPKNNQSDASIMLARHAYFYSKHKDNFMTLIKKKGTARQSNSFQHNSDKAAKHILRKPKPISFRWQAERLSKQHNISIHQANLISEILGFGRAA